MPEIVLAWLLVAVGIAGLVWSADRFVAGSAAIANNLGLSKMMIGLTIVSLGTSAPEILVSFNASLKGEGDLAVGNALGSNLANLGLVLAVTALVAAIPIQKGVLFQEMPVLLAITLLAGLFLYDGQLAHWEGWCLLLIIPPLLYLMVRYKGTLPVHGEAEIPEMKTARAVFWFVVGLVLLVVSSDLLVRGAREIALYFGVAPLVVGLTVVAVGTSLPELAASVASALKGHHDIALGNVVGSNIFNLLAVMSIPGIINAISMESAVFYRDYLAMAGLTLLLCLAIAVDYWRDKPADGAASQARLGKVMGAALLLLYLAYYVVLFNS